MNNLRVIHTKLDSRVETGPTQIGDDWPGLFIRGDNAFHYAMCLRNVLDGKDDWGISRAALESLYKDLTSSRVR